MKKIALLLVMLMLAITVTAASKLKQVQTKVADLKERLAPDGRTALWDVNVHSKGRAVILYGLVGTQEMKSQLETVFKDDNRVTVEVRVAQDIQPADKRWGLVKLAVATLRCQGKHSAEVATQAVMGTPVKVLDDNGDWYRVQLPDDYIAWVPSSSLQFRTTNQMLEWRESKRSIVTVYGSQLVSEPGGDEIVSDLVLSCILNYMGEQGDWLHVSTPDGREGWVEKAAVADFDTWKQQPFDLALIERTARRMMGSGYLWGGTSTKVTDCSGLMKVSYLANGIILQRDASQQALTGKKIADWHDCTLGDLLFFGNSKTGRVTHVGMYLRDGKYIHCSGQVKINDLDTNAPGYLYSPLSISRVQGQIGTKGITTVAAHPWY